jgi:hypothetical protein
MYRKYEGEGCNFSFEDNEFFGRVATMDPLLYGISLLHVIFQEVL